MKILVNNEKEKALAERFVECLKEVGIDTMSHDDSSWARDNDDSPLLSSVEWSLMNTVVNNQISIVCDSNETEMCFDYDDCITGKCHKCGTYTSGVGDIDEEITYSYYLKTQSKEEQDKWICDSCYRKLDDDDEWWG